MDTKGANVCKLSQRSKTLKKQKVKNTEKCFQTATILKNLLLGLQEREALASLNIVNNISSDKSSTASKETVGDLSQQQENNSLSNDNKKNRNAMENSSGSGFGAERTQKKNLYTPKMTKNKNISRLSKSAEPPVWTPLRKSKARTYRAMVSALANVDSSEIRRRIDPLQLDSPRPLFSVAAIPGNRLLAEPCLLTEDKQQPTATESNTDNVRDNTIVIADENPNHDQRDLGQSAAGENRAFNNNADLVKETEADAAAVVVVVESSEPASGEAEHKDTDGEIEECCSTPKRNPVRSPVRYSTILQQCYGDADAEIRGSIVSPERFAHFDKSPAQIKREAAKVLRGCTVYVEVRKDQDDLSSGFRWKLKQLGATVAMTFSKQVTHVVFKGGLLSTFRKARASKVHLVSSTWVIACDETLSRVNEKDYPIQELQEYELIDPFKKVIRRPKVLSPDPIRDAKQLKRIRQGKLPSRRSRHLSQPLPSQPKEETPKCFSTISITPDFASKISEAEEELFDDDDEDGFLAEIQARVLSKFTGNEAEAKSTEASGQGEEAKDETTETPCQTDSKKEGKRKSSIFAPLSSRLSLPRRTPVKTEQTPQPTKSGTPHKPVSLMDWLTKKKVKSSETSSSSSGAASVSAEDKKSSSSKVVKKRPSLKGSEASASAMRSWLSSSVPKRKTPSPESPRHSKPPAETESASANTPSRRRSTRLTPMKNYVEFDDLDLDIIDEIDDNVITYGTPVKIRKEFIKSAPTKTTPTRATSKKATTPQRRRSVQASPIKSESFSTISSGETLCTTPVRERRASERTPTKGTTPGRRSLRLTPIKTDNLANLATALDTLHEEEDALTTTTNICTS